MTEHAGAGPILDYLRDISRVRPELAGIEQYSFTADINAAGVITAQTASRTTHPDFVFAMRRAKGFVQDPAVSPAAPSLVQWNVRDQGRQTDVFRDPIFLSIMVGTSGPAHDMLWDSAYVFIQGADVSVAWTVDAAAWAALVGVPKLVGVSLTGDKVNVSKKGGVGAAR